VFISDKTEDGTRAGEAIIESQKKGIGEKGRGRRPEGE